MNEKYTEDRAHIIENLIIKLGDAGDKDLVNLLDNYEDEIEELKEKIKEVKCTARHIYDLGFDNDGFEDAEDLKKLCRGLAAEAAEICKLLEQVDLETKEDAE